MRSALFLTLFLVLAVSVQAAECRTAEFQIPSEFTLEEGERFIFEINSSNSSFSFSPIASNFTGFQITQDGIIEVIPLQEDVGIHKILLIAYAGEDCYSTQLIEFTVLDRPALEATPKDTVIYTEEGRGVRFKVEIEDSDDENHTIEWRLNGKIVSNTTSYNYLPGYNESGLYTLDLVVRDDDDLEGKESWNMSVKNMNRAPVQIASIPDILILTSSTNRVYDLVDYFLDPDGDKLSFSKSFIKPSDESIVRVENVEVDIQGSRVVVTSFSSEGYNFLKYTAQDPSGEEIESNNVKVVIKKDPRDDAKNCGDGFCSAAESCSFCPEDCGVCNADCEPNWICSNWGACTPTNLQSRSCTDVNTCNRLENKPAEVQYCDYFASCFDGIRNNGESGIDCGGPCGPCPTCSDGVMNQGEEGIDCGGPCGICPTCNDNIKNQKEGDVDCGGACPPCASGQSCNNDFDCESFVCESEKCMLPSCSDGIRNQDEKRIDCGGSCDACPTCSDGMLNQGEERIDCGGPCTDCPTCSDGMRNQDERLTDCGGSCSRCTFNEYVKYYKVKEIILIGFISSVLMMIMLRVLSDILLYISLNYASSIHRHERETNIDRMIKMNRFSRLFRLRRSRGSDFSDYIKRLKEADHRKGDVVGIIMEFFNSIFSIPERKGYDYLYNAIRNSIYPVSVRVLLVVLLRRMWFVIRADSSLPEEIDALRRDAILIISELSKDID